MADDVALRVRLRVEADHQAVVALGHVDRAERPDRPPLTGHEPLRERGRVRRPVAGDEGDRQGLAGRLGVVPG